MNSATERTICREIKDGNLLTHVYIHAEREKEKKNAFSYVFNGQT
jgi:hypothetical protein